MARVTIEDSMEKAKNRFALVILAATRAKQLVRKEARPLVESKNREVVVALREIAAGKVAYAHPEDLDKLMDSSYALLSDDNIEFVVDDDEGE